MSAAQVLPPLPAGYKLDSSTPPLPPGYKLENNPRELLDLKYTPPDDGAIYHAIKEAGGDLLGAAKGLFHTATDLPKDETEIRTAIAGGPIVGMPAVVLKRMVHGYYKTVEDSIEKAKKSAEEGDMSGVMTHSAAAGLPLVGPLTEGVYDKAKSGDTSGAVGLGASRIAQLMSMAPEKSVIPNPTTALVNATAKGVNAGLKAAEPAASRLYQSALKPPPASYSSAEVGKMVDTGLKEGIPVSEEGAAKISTLVSDLSDKVKAQIKAGAQNGQTINKFKVSARLADAAKKFSNQVSPTADLNALGETGNDFLATQPGKIPVEVAQDLKKGTYQQLSSKAYGEMGSATTEAQKALARGIKEELEAQFPEIKANNARTGRLIDLDEVLQRAVRREANKQVFPASPLIVGGVSAAATGSGLVGTAALVLKAIVDHPELKSRLAIAISKGSKVSMNAAYAKVAGYSAALAHATTSDDSSSQSSERGH